MFEFRPANADDLPQVAELERQCFECPHTLAQMQNFLESGCLFWVAVDAAGLCGYAIAREVAGEADLLLVAVAPDRQRQGLARQLLSCLRDALCSRQVSSIFLEVRRSNLAAIGLYESLGFEQISFRKDYYPTIKGLREDALVFKLSLKA